MSEKPLSLDEAANFLGLRKSYLYKLTSKGRIPFYRPSGGRLYFKPEDLENFVFRGRRAADYEIHERADAILTGSK